MYGSATDRVWPATLQQTMAIFGANMTVDSFYGFTSGDLLVVAQNNVCTLTQLTATPVTATPTLQHNTSTSSIYNIAAGGTFTAYTTGGMVFNLGPTPVSRTYSISGGNLVSGDILALAAGGSTQTIVNDIVDLRAQYGKDNGTDNSTVSHATFTANDGIIDSFDNTTPTTAAGWQQVLAVRIAVLARSSNYVKPETGSCSASPATMTWSGGTFTIPDRCYNYRIFETVVPLRNMIWRTV
jgi:type IV pilus assembly protein PilW